MRETITYEVKLAPSRDFPLELEVGQQLQVRAAKKGATENVQFGGQAVAGVKDLRGDDSTLRSEAGDDTHLIVSSAIAQLTRTLSSDKNLAKNKKLQPRSEGNSTSTWFSFNLKRLLIFLLLIAAINYISGPMHIEFPSAQKVMELSDPVIAQGLVPTKQTRDIERSAVHAIQHGSGNDSSFDTTEFYDKTRQDVTSQCIDGHTAKKPMGIARNGDKDETFLLRNRKKGNKNGFVKYPNNDENHTSSDTRQRAEQAGRNGAASSNVLSNVQGFPRAALGTGGSAGGGGNDKDKDEKFYWWGFFIDISDQVQEPLTIVVPGSSACKKIFQEFFDWLETMQRNEALPYWYNIRHITQINHFPHKIIRERSLAMHHLPLYQRRKLVPAMNERQISEDYTRALSVINQLLLTETLQLPSSDPPNADHNLFQQIRGLLVYQISTDQTDISDISGNQLLLTETLQLPRSDPPNADHNLFQQIRGLPVYQISTDQADIIFTLDQPPPASNNQPITAMLPSCLDRPPTNPETQLNLQQGISLAATSSSIASIRDNNSSNNNNQSTNAEPYNNPGISVNPGIIQSLPQGIPPSASLDELSMLQNSSSDIHADRLRDVDPGLAEIFQRLNEVDEPDEWNNQPSMDTTNQQTPPYTYYDQDPPDGPLVPDAEVTGTLNSSSSLFDTVPAVTTFAVEEEFQYLIFPVQPTEEQITAVAVQEEIQYSDQRDPVTSDALPEMAEGSHEEDEVVDGNMPEPVEELLLTALNEHEEGNCFEVRQAQVEDQPVVAESAREDDPYVGETESSLLRRLVVVTRGVQEKDPDVEEERQPLRPEIIQHPVEN